ncbi:MAG: Lrp/AsnC family transcriptional regulator [Clostridia bacterium]|nr:Lrp/AsnC family transcriptional regulator [Clostridia bacterium]
MDSKAKILDILDKNGERANLQKIAQMIGKSEEDVENIVKGLEKENVIVGYKTLINWDLTDAEIVDALIELKITPQRGEGFDRVAEKIYKYPQVKSLYLMSGAYDLAVMIQGTTMKDVALFVAEKLAPMDHILSTATHFVLKKYKEDGLIFYNNEEDTRQVITL